MKISQITLLSFILIEISSISIDFDEFNYLSASSTGSDIDIQNLLNLTNHLNVLLGKVSYNTNISQE